MAQTQRAQGPSDPDASGGGMADSPEVWGNGGLVGDGRYRLTHRLGRGGMAEVFAAEDVRLGRTVAVKLLRADLAEDPVSKARFTREAQSVAGLNHHAVVAVYDSGEDVIGNRAVPYIVMELVEGRTIRDLLLNAEAPPPDQALIIVSGVLEALAYSHHHGIVHRDIKPANVIITHGGAVKVMDFGIARALHGASTTMTQTGMVMGTPQYLSPEQALGKAVDHRSDLYATGCLLYELLALRPPFVGETPLSVVYQHVQDTPVPPSEVSDSAPPELDGLVMRSLAKDPDDRFQSAEEMRGLVQYGLQMLAERGAHTGAWDTGPVMHAGGATAVMGAVGTTAMPHPVHGDTSQIGAPLLPGGRDDDGGFHGGPHGGGGGAGSGRGKVWLLAALAVIAVVVGVVMAMPFEKKGSPDTVKPQNSPSKSQDSSPSVSQSEDRPPVTEPDTSTGGEGGWTPPRSHSRPSTRPSTPSHTPSQSSSGDASPPATSGGGQGGTSTGTGSGGSNSSPSTSTQGGASNGNNGDPKGPTTSGGGGNTTSVGTSAGSGTTTSGGTTTGGTGGGTQ
ncbi:protein kinase domain-containing protein [Streptomyces sp. URMC 123]|uniref:protein kinase domain-containing protein n=1 Tax=Streptomyces sp. URMC 123 TaxID=3423403 RepID=UPI003F1CAC8A